MTGQEGIPADAVAAGSGVDSETWTCQGCLNVFIGNRPAGAAVEMCKGCTAAAMHEPADAPHGYMNLSSVSLDDEPTAVVTEAGRSLVVYLAASFNAPSVASGDLRWWRQLHQVIGEGIEQLAAARAVDAGPEAGEQR
jgi:hypothetical protein